MYYHSSRCFMQVRHLNYTHKRVSVASKIVSTCKCTTPYHVNWLGFFHTIVHRLLGALFKRGLVLLELRTSIIPTDFKHLNGLFCYYFKMVCGWHDSSSYKCSHSPMEESGQNPVPNTYPHLNMPIVVF